MAHTHIKLSKNDIANIVAALLVIRDEAVKYDDEPLAAELKEPAVRVQSSPFHDTAE